MSLCNQYPAGTIMISPSLYHTLLRKDILSENKGIIGIQLYSLSTFLSLQNDDELNPYEVIFSCYNALQTYDQKVDVFSNIYTSYDFIKQCISILKEIMFYHIDLETLPKKNLTQLELYHILTYLYPIVQHFDEVHLQLKQIEKQDMHHLVIYDPSPSYHDEMIYQQLQSLGATRMQLPQGANKKAFYHAINKRKEIEACAQYIIQQNIDASDVHIYVCDPSYKAIIAQVFSRYEIPFTNLQENHTNIITKRFLNLLQYAIKPSMASILELLESNTLEVSHPREFIEYTQIFDKQIQDRYDHMSYIHTGSELIDEREIEQLKQLEERAAITRNEILTQLEVFTIWTSTQNLFQDINRIVLKSMNRFQSQQSDALKQMQRILVDISSYIHKKEDLPFAYDILSLTNTTVNEKEYCGCLIADMKHSLTPTPYTFILGVTQKNYPAFSPLTGIFDEAYMKETTYPSLPTRYDFHMQCLHKKLAACEHLIVSYPLGSYEGKGNEAALEMEEYLGVHSQSYPLVENYQAIASNFTIDASTAQKLYLKEDTLYGSISAFERYVKCPFSYFLRYGLGLREPMDRSFSPSRIGTLSHLVLEKFVEQHGKQYAQATQDEILFILSSEMQAMANVYPSFEKQLELCKKRLLHSIEKTLQRLQEMEEHSALTPRKCEYPFTYSLELNPQVNMLMKGFIDRIDESSGFVRILDYKSSVKSLQEKEVFAALQLQLITYSLVAEEDLHKSVLGAYYYSLKNENIMCSAGKLKRRPIEFVSFTKEDYEADQLATHRMRGWTMNFNVDLLDDDGSHILGVSKNKDGVIKARKTYDLAVLKEHFHTMYKIIGNDILSGKIDATPVEEACMFCKYQAICRFHGYYREHTALIEVDDAIYQGGEE